MIYHYELNTATFAGKRQLKSLIDESKIILAGNKKLKIYGTLLCNSGKRMSKKNRVFFNSESEAIEQGYRPCGNCIKSKYQKWKNETVQ